MMLLAPVAAIKGEDLIGIIVSVIVGAYLIWVLIKAERL